MGPFNFPRSTIDALEALNVPISLVGIENAISPLKMNKAPGPDGFTAEFYKLFQSILSRTYFLAV